MDLSQLPETIKDAVKVTRSLGLVYLWVDALCIAQDDPEDCAIEIAKMSNIYKGATITISAARAKECSEGFLGDRDLLKTYGRQFRLPYRHRSEYDVVEGSVFLSEFVIGDTHQDPIDERAWTMQEHELSLIIIRFGSKQTTWKCPTFLKSISIDGGSSHEIDEGIEISVLHPHLVTEMQSESATLGSEGEVRALSNWYHFISWYTDRKLSQPSDRLPACAALAETFAVTLVWRSSYLAGIWKCNTYVGLLWFRRIGPKAQRIPGPSWSWALSDGNLFEARVKLEKHDISHKFRGHEYSEVVSGRLWLNGRLRLAVWDGIHLKQSIGASRDLTTSYHMGLI